MTFDTGRASYRSVGDASAPKYLLTAYLVAVFFGVLGFHRAYLRKYKDAAIYILGITLGTLLLIPAEPEFLKYIGYAAIALVVLGWVVDLIRMPKLVAEANAAAKAAESAE